MALEPWLWIRGGGGGGSRAVGGGAVGILQAHPGEGGQHRVHLPAKLLALCREAVNSSQLLMLRFHPGLYGVVVPRAALVLSLRRHLGRRVERKVCPGLRSRALLLR